MLGFVVVVVVADLSFLACVVTKISAMKFGNGKRFVIITTDIKVNVA